MVNQERRSALVGLVVLALAFGWIEASVVVYLREIATRTGAVQIGNYFSNLQIALASLPSPFVALEVAREACTLVLLGAAAWLAGRRAVGRIGAFVAMFGVWDLTYYAVLQLVTGWPGSLRTWDILFLIPVPWIAPVWAPGTIATLFVLGGGYLFWTADRERRYRWTDIGVLLASAGLILAAFFAGSGAALAHRVPDRFPVWLFWSGVAVATGWFAHVERRARRESEESPWLAMRVRTAVGSEDVMTERIRPRIDEESRVERHSKSDLDRVTIAYRAAMSRQSELTKEAGELAERFERLAHGLSTRPGHLVIGVPDEELANPTEWEILPSEPLPSIEQLGALTEEIRQVGARVEELREQLILMGHSERLEQPDGFFH